jgi:hypothetical protein
MYHLLEEYHFAFCLQGVLFLMILTVNSDYFLKQRLPVGRDGCLLNFWKAMSSYSGEFHL